MLKEGEAAVRIEQVRFLLEAAYQGSLAAAAKQEFMKQTTLSASVAAAEKEIGGALFFRTSRGVELTPLGSQALPHLRAIQEHYEALLSLGASAASVPRPLGLVLTVAAHRSWCLKASELLRSSGGPELEAERIPLSQIHARLLDGAACLGVGICLGKDWPELQQRADESGLYAECLLPDRLWVCGAPAAGLDKTGPLPLEALSELPLALGRDLLEFAAHIPRGRKSAVLCDMDAAAEMAVQDSLACVLPGLAVQNLREDMEARPLQTKLVHYCVHPQEAVIPAAGKLVLAGLRDKGWALNSLINQPAPAPNGTDPLQSADVGGGISLHQEKVSLQTGTERAVFSFQPQNRRA